MCIHPFVMHNYRVVSRSPMIKLNFISQTINVTRVDKNGDISQCSLMCKYS